MDRKNKERKGDGELRELEVSVSFARDMPKLSWTKQLERIYWGREVGTDLFIQSGHRPGGHHRNGKCTVFEGRPILTTVYFKGHADKGGTEI
jgi:hypothetical protein